MSSVKAYEKALGYSSDNIVFNHLSFQNRAVLPLPILGEAIDINGHKLAYIFPPKGARRSNSMRYLPYIVRVP
jgi:hypothetical protein